MTRAKFHSSMDSCAIVRCKSWIHILHKTFTAVKEVLSFNPFLYVNQMILQFVLSEMDPCIPSSFH